MAKINKRGYPLQQRILFEADPELRKMLLELQKFYLFRTRNKVFPYIILMAVFDVARLKEDKKWTKRQRESFLFCKKAAEDFQKALVITAAKKVLAKQPKNAKMSVPALMRKTKKEIKNVGHPKTS